MDIDSSDSDSNYYEDSVDTMASEHVSNPIEDNPDDTVIDIELW